MLASEFFKKWYAAFASNVDPLIMREKVTGRGCFPWHIFTFGKVQCLSGDEALKAYLNSNTDEIVYVYVGFDYKNGAVKRRKNNIIELTHLMQEGTEVFIASHDFSWTFVWTHEGYLFGPYFLKV
ncbi:MAG: DUF4275 family protein [Clostridiales bacterium]|nr:DUF4275 family protein [Clostridiales bacterium]